MSLSTVVTMGYEIGSVGLVTTLGYGQGAIPPPPPVLSNQTYGPALSEADRQRWFADYEDPCTKEEKKKLRERAKRIELGIIQELVIPKPIRAEVKEIVKAAVRVEVRVEPDDSQIIESVARSVAEELALDFKTEKLEARALAEEKRLEDEEDEAIEAITLFMMN